MKQFLFFTFFLFLWCSNDVAGQRFKAAAIIGANAAQIDGDSLYGFERIGLTLGGRLSYTNDKVWDIALEMLYSQRGSADGLFKKNSNRGIALHYLEIPVLFSLRDWYIEEGKYYKVRAEGGFSYGRLFQTDAVGYDLGDLKKYDFSWIIGAGVNFNRTFGMSLRYTSSFVDINHEALLEGSRFKSYFLTLRGEINF